MELDNSQMEIATSLEVAKSMSSVKVDKPTLFQSEEFQEELREVEVITSHIRSMPIDSARRMF